jgi:hypothetical protein
VTGGFAEDEVEVFVLVVGGTGLEPVTSAV